MLFRAKITFELGQNAKYTVKPISDSSKSDISITIDGDRAILEFECDHIPTGIVMNFDCNQALEETSEAKEINPEQLPEEINENGDEKQEEILPAETNAIREPQISKKMKAPQKNVIDNIIIYAKTADSYLNFILRVINWLKIKKTRLIYILICAIKASQSLQQIKWGDIEKNLSEHGIVISNTDYLALQRFFAKGLPEYITIEITPMNLIKAIIHCKGIYFNDAVKEKNNLPEYKNLWSMVYFDPSFSVRSEVNDSTIPEITAFAKKSATYEEFFESVTNWLKITATLKQWIFYVVEASQNLNQLTWGNIQERLAEKEITLNFINYYTAFQTKCKQISISAGNKNIKPLEVINCIISYREMYFEKNTLENEGKSESEEDNNFVQRLETSDEGSKGTKLENSDEEIEEAELEDSDEDNKGAESEESNKDNKGAELEDSDEDSKGAELEESNEDSKGAELEESNEDSKGAELEESDECSKDLKLKDSDEDIEETELEDSDEDIEEAEFENSEDFDEDIIDDEVDLQESDNLDQEVIRDIKTQFSNFVRKSYSYKDFVKQIFKWLKVDKDAVYMFEHVLKAAGEVEEITWNNIEQNLAKHGKNINRTDYNFIAQRCRNLKDYKKKGIRLLDIIRVVIEYKKNYFNEQGYNSQKIYDLSKVFAVPYFKNILENLDKSQELENKVRYILNSMGLKRKPLEDRIRILNIANLALKPTTDISSFFAQMSVYERIIFSTFLNEFIKEICPEEMISAEDFLKHLRNMI